MAIQARIFTHKDLEREREATSDRVELLAGEIVVTPAPTISHQRIAGRLYSIFDRLLPEQVYFAPLDVRLAAFTIVQPDIIVVTSDREAVLTDSRIEGAPTIVAEIVSPSSSPRDAVAKRDLYALHEVPEYWHVDPFIRRVTIFSEPSNGQYRTARTFNDIAVSATIPELTVDLARLFAPIPGSRIADR